MLYNFHSLLGFAFEVKLKAEYMVGLCKGVINERELIL